MKVTFGERGLAVEMPGAELATMRSLNATLWRVKGTAQVYWAVQPRYPRDVALGSSYDLAEDDDEIDEQRNYAYVCLRKRGHGVMPAKNRKVRIDVKSIRTELNLSQDELARALSVASITVQRWESKGTTPLPIYREMLRAMRDAKAAQKVD